MYTTTPRGSLIPITAVRSVTDTPRGCFVSLLDGTKFNDTRTPVEFMESFGTTVPVMLATDAVTKLGTELSALESVVKDVQTRIHNNALLATRKVTKVTDELVSARTLFTREVREVGSGASRLNKVCKELQSAIQEA